MAPPPTSVYTPFSCLTSQSPFCLPFHSFLLSDYSQSSDPSGALNFNGKAVVHASGVDFSNGASFSINMTQFQLEEELGKGNYGTVRKVLHKPTNVYMAMKVRTSSPSSFPLPLFHSPRGYVVIPFVWTILDYVFGCEHEKSRERETGRTSARCNSVEYPGLGLALRHEGTRRHSSFSPGPLTSHPLYIFSHFSLSFFSLRFVVRLWYLY